MVASMKEAIVAKGPKVTIKDVPIPEPGPDQVVIKVVVSGSNPKDWYVYHTTSKNINSLSCSTHILSILHKNND
jgi:NADPH:quinone reductase-like Zn-dependent oxidoreductase